MKNIFNHLICNISFSGQYFFQKPSTELMFRIIDLHNDIMIVIVSILVFVLFLLARLFNPCSFLKYEWFSQWFSTLHSKQERLTTFLYFGYKLIVKFIRHHKYFPLLGVFLSYSNYFIKKNQENKNWIIDKYLPPQSYFLQTYLINTPFRFHHHTLLEIIWTLIPTFILTIILFLSLGLIYAMDNIFDDSFERSALITLKIIGNQWYWTYQTTNGLLNKEVIFDSYLDNVITEERPLRLLQVDKEVYLPINTKIRLLITSNDVIHSWAIPTCGIKMDAIPGRINSIGLEVVTLGYKIGQCSELCGTGHAFMPIVLKVITLPEYFEICKLVEMFTFKNYISLIIKKQKHSFHLVSPSLLPFLSSFFILIVLEKIVSDLHNKHCPLLNWFSSFFVQIIFISVVLFWFNSITRESIKGFHTTKVQNGLRFGMLLFIVSEIMFFFAFFWAFFHFSIAPSILIGQAWPPLDTQQLKTAIEIGCIEKNFFITKLPLSAMNSWDIGIDYIIPNIEIPLSVMNTILLLSSGFTITLAHDYILKNQNKAFLINLFFTIVLGIVFLICQVHEYVLFLNFSWKEDIFGAGFYITTGFHGLHVTIGTLFLLYCLIRGIVAIIKPWKLINEIISEDFSIILWRFMELIMPTNYTYYQHEDLELYLLNIFHKKNIKSNFHYNQHIGFEAAAWYWHFVDVVWLFLFITIYWWGNYVFQR